MEQQTKATISVEEAGQVLGISRGLAYEMARQGKLPVIRLGRRLLISKRRFEDLLGGDWQPPTGGILKHYD